MKKVIIHFMVNILYIFMQQQPPKCQTYCPDCSQHWVFRIQSNNSSLKVKSVINH